MIDIKSDSRKVKQGDTFIALRGFGSDGHSYIPKAIANGAAKLIVEEAGDYSVPFEIVPDTRAFLTKYLAEKYGSIIEKMTIIGFTGTNGKTTSAYLLQNALTTLGKPCAYIGTIGYYISGKLEEKLENTSPDICDLYEYILRAHEEGCNHIALEASSQGLEFGRLNGIPFDYAVFSNLTIDHLDHHKTMENYADAKAILFDLLVDDGKSILNFDDPFSKRFETKNTIYYGIGGGDVRAVDIVYYNGSTAFV
jgi:UDP-N-acetylmuramoyl-L-alanyl-D-glutamate--2,6-diaminopimelate ligase